MMISSALTRSRSHRPGDSGGLPAVGKADSIAAPTVAKTHPFATQKGRSRAPGISQPRLILRPLESAIAIPPVVLHARTNSGEPTDMNRRAFLLGGMACLPLCLAGSRARAADATAAGPGNRATIFYSFAPWDGAAYDLEIPLGPPDASARPFVRISIWGYPEFREAQAIHFSGKEDPGGGPLRGDGRALFQADLNKSMPDTLAGNVSFRALLHDRPVSGSYDLATLDGKRRFKGDFQAAWGNKPGAAGG